MQARAPELGDFSAETKATLAEYGADPDDPKAAFANNCLLARRLAERGVRFVQVYHAGWDHHSDVEGGVRAQCAQTDRAAAALVRDLARRGLLEDTLVVWGGEFGRTPMVESSAALGRSKGRDHHPQAFTMWLSGGGVKAGVTVGRTDELGFHPVERPVHVHDVQATILHLLGLDHERLTFRLRGLDFRLTGVEEHHPVTELFAG
jgi:arylsulfatase A-like enzyme